MKSLKTLRILQICLISIFFICVTASLAYAAETSGSIGFVDSHDSGNLDDPPPPDDTSGSEKPGSGIDSPDDGSLDDPPPPDNTPASQKSGSSSSVSAKTGDEGVLFFFGFTSAAAMSFVVLVAVFLGKRKRTERS